MTTSSEVELVRRLGAGDAAALEAVYRAYAPRCNAIAYRVLKEHGAAQDAVQEAFFSLWRHREGLVVRSAGIGPWLTVVTRNAALAILRSGRARAAREDRVQTVDATRGEDPSRIATERDEASAVRGALAQLPDATRMVVELAYFRFMTLAQIAQATETPLGTVKYRAQSGLRKLAQLLTQERTR
jgi:RNA polymerase sigma-70 factor (ECF subfamily)